MADLIVPVRLRLSRAKGFSLQAVSLALNGLGAVKVDRATPWGNPFVPGLPNPMIPGRNVTDRRHAWQLFRSVAPLKEEAVARVRAELGGKNLACWCPSPEPYEDDECHAAVLLRLANPLIWGDDPCQAVLSGPHRRNA